MIIFFRRSKRSPIKRKRNFIK